MKQIYNVINPETNLSHALYRGTRGLLLFAFLITSTFVTSATVDGGTVTSNLGDTLNICAGDGVANPFVMSNTSVSPDSFIYIITSPNTEVLGISTDGALDLEGAGGGECWVWGLSYTGSLLIAIGDTVSTFGLASDSTADFSANYVVVNRTGVDAGIVTSNLGDTVHICTGDGVADPISMINTTTAAAPYAYIITTPQTVVIGTNVGGNINLDPVGIPECWIWGVSFTGNGLFGVGDTLSTFGALSDGCSHLSPNYVVVQKTYAIAGTVFSDKGSTVNICTGDGVPDPIVMTNNSATTENYLYIIASPATEILAMQTDSVIDLDGAGGGTCLIAGFSYSGNLLIGVGDTINTFGPMSDECADLSPNVITVNRTFVQGGNVTSNLGDTLKTCVGDGIPDPFSVSNSSTSSATYAYIVTNPQTVVLATSISGNFNFENNGPGECWVWGVSYTGSGLFTIGDTLATFGALSTGCYSLSDDYTVVMRTSTDGGSVTSDLGDTLDICAGDGVPDPFVMSSTTVSSETYTYIITSPSTEVLGISSDSTLDLDGAGAGECWVWGLSHSGNLLISVGDTVSSFGPLTDACYDLSSNYVVVMRTGVAGGTVTSDLGDSLSICIDGNPDPFVMSNTGDTSVSYTYVVTNSATEILAIDSAGMLDFDGAGTGECWVWGMSYTGNILAIVGDTVSTFGPLSDGCFDLSDNYVVVVRTTPDAATVTSDLGDTLNICAGDGIPNPFVMSNSSASNSTYTYVVTSSSTEVLAISSAGVLDFDGAGAGECWVWGVSHTGNILIGVGDTVNSFGALTEGCFDLSSNFVVVMRTGVDGGTVSTLDGDTAVTICINYPTQSTVNFDHLSSSTESYSYLVTDANNDILGIPAGNSNDFAGAGEGICRVWGLSYTGAITTEIGENIFTDTLTDGCYVLSGNYIEVERFICGGIEEASIAMSLDIYPNPVSSTLIMEVSNVNIASIKQIEVINILGDRVLSEIWNGNRKDKRINVADLSPGLYFVRMYIGEEVLTSKFVKN